MILLTGASASGKTETAKELKILFGIKKVVTHTTRKMREGEVNNVDYHFVSEEEFKKLQAQDYFVETTLYSGHHYGTSKKEIADDKVVVVETNGARVFLNLNDPHIVCFRLIAPIEMRAERMRLRGDSQESIKERLANDVTRFADEEFKDPRIINIDTSNLSVQEVASKIYKIYLEKIK
ncbi:MAG: guanylate kinase [Bacilli bacterium]|nr:guanylate kinase [Bacilli bacterium]